MNENLNETVQMNQPPRLGGWLLLVAFGLVVSTIRLNLQLWQVFVPLIRDGGWKILTSPESPAYHPYWGPLLVFEIASTISMIALAVITFIFMMQRSRHTPRMAITWLSISALLVTADFFLADLIPAVAAEPDASSLKELTKSLLSACIWIPYFLRSERVKRTFIR